MDLPSLIHRKYCFKCKLVSYKISNISGYLAVECLDVDGEMDQICGLCGIIPEAILGKY